MTRRTCLSFPGTSRTSSNGAQWFLEFEARGSVANVRAMETSSGCWFRSIRFNMTCMPSAVRVASIRYECYVEINRLSNVERGLSLLLEQARLHCPSRFSLVSSTTMRSNLPGSEDAMYILYLSTKVGDRARTSPKHKVRHLEYFYPVINGGRKYQCLRWTW